MSTKSSSTLDKRLKDLEQRVALLEAGQSRFDGGKQERARDWLIDYLKQRKEEYFNNVRIPAYSDLAWRILNTAQAAGISRALLRRARRDANIAVDHLQRSRNWVWRLPERKKNA